MPDRYDQYSCHNADHFSPSCELRCWSARHLLALRPDCFRGTQSWDKIRPDPREQGDAVRQPVGDRATFTH